jgi:hypothetical protein
LGLHTLFRRLCRYLGQFGCLLLDLCLQLLDVILELYLLFSFGHLDFFGCFNLISDDTRLLNSDNTFLNQTHYLPTVGCDQDLLLAWGRYVSDIDACNGFRDLSLESKDRVRRFVIIGIDLDTAIIPSDNKTMSRLTIEIASLNDCY